MRKNIPGVVIFIVFLILGISLRVYYAQKVIHPGKIETINHFIVAENLYSERGFIEDFIYLYPEGNDQSVTHPSNSFWMPGTSIIIFFSFLIFGKSLIAAGIISIIASFLIGYLAYLITKELTENRILPAYSFLFTLFLPSLFIESLIPSSKIFFALFALHFFYWLIIGLKRNPLYLILSSLPAALATLTKIDGFLLLPVLILTAFLYRKKSTFKNVLITLGCFIIIITPWFIRNYLAFGSIYPPGLNKLLYLTSYDDLFSLNKTISFGEYFDSGIFNILFIKLKSFILFIYQIISDGTIIITVLSLIGLILMIRTRSIRREVAAFLFYLIILIGAFSIVFTIHSLNGGAENSTLSLLAPLIIFSILTIEKLFSGAQEMIFLQKTFLMVILLVFICFSIVEANLNLKNNFYTYDEYVRLKEYLRTNEKEEPIIMTEKPIEAYYASGYKSIMIPNDTDSTFFAIAKLKKANYALAPAKRIDLTKNPTKFELKYIDPYTDLKLYKIINN